MRSRGIAVLAATAALLLSSCSATDTAPAAPRAVGDCWVAQDALPATALNSSKAQSAPCSEVSNAYTYAVGEIKNAPAGSYLSDGFLDADSLTDLPPPSMGESISQYCQLQLQEFMGGAVLSALRQSRVIWNVTVPTTQQWESGERWFSCEAGVLALDAPYAEREMEKPAGGIRAHLEKARSSLVSFGLCVETPSNTLSPNSAEARVALCADARWALRQLPLESSAGDFYPGVSQAADMAATRCSEAFPQALRVIAVKLTESVWSAPEASLGCWVSDKDDTAATPSATPSPSPSRGSSGGGEAPTEPTDGASDSPAPEPPAPEPPAPEPTPTEEPVVP